VDRTRRHLFILACALGLLGLVGYICIHALRGPVSLNAPVRFCGRVVDESGIGVPQVVVTAELRAVAPLSSPVAPRYDRQALAATSDGMGYFTFTASSGKFLEINSFEKAGWELKGQGVGVRTQFEYPQNPYFPPPPTDPSKPFVYTMVRKGTPATRSY
jgi:hypothetical protein